MSLMMFRFSNQNLTKSNCLIINKKIHTQRMHILIYMLLGMQGLDISKHNFGGVGGGR